jgi:uncharacterized membrane protein
MASELGILSKSPPRLITTFAQVPPGTNGAMSRSGTLASLVGGAIMGVTMLFSLIIESPACRVEIGKHALSLVLTGACGGLGGSAVSDAVQLQNPQMTRVIFSLTRCLELLFSARSFRM